MERKPKHPEEERAFSWRVTGPDDLDRFLPAVSGLDDEEAMTGYLREPQDDDPDLLRPDMDPD